MDLEQLARLAAAFAPLAAVVVVGVGWWVTHRSESRRDLANDRRKMLVSYLIEAYRKLEDAANRGDGSKAKAKWGQLESAIAAMQLLGSVKQVDLAQELARSLSDTGKGDVVPLLEDLRAALRKELELDSVQMRIRFLRFTDQTNNDSPGESTTPAGPSLERLRK